MVGGGGLGGVDAQVGEGGDGEGMLGAGEMLELRVGLGAVDGVEIGACGGRVVVERAEVHLVVGPRVGDAAGRVDGLVGDPVVDLLGGLL